MRNLRKPAVYLGLAGVIIFFVGLAMKEREYAYSALIMYGGLILGGLFWIWCIIEVATSNELKYYQKMFWLILTVAVPFFGGLLFHFLHQRPGKIVT